MLAFVKKLLFVFVLAAVLLFGIQPENLQALSGTIQFHLKIWDIWNLYTTPAFPIALLFVVFFLLGMVLAGFHGVYERLARRVEIRRRDRKIGELERELSDLRSQVAELSPPADALAADESLAPAPTSRPEDSPPPRKPEEEVPTL